MKNTSEHEYEAPAMFELGDAKELTKGNNGEDKMDYLGGWRWFWGGGGASPEGEE